MRSLFSAALVCAIGAGVALPASAQSRRPTPGEERQQQEQQQKRNDDSWNILKGRLPGGRAAGPCPYVKVLYDAARYQEFSGGRVGFANAGYTGEIHGVEADCAYKDAEPIRLRMAITFALGKGPRAQGDGKSYRYWVAVTRRNSTVLAKQYFDLPVSFGGEDRALVSDEIESITIPRANKDVSGANFEVLVGFDVTPEMAAFNREGKRFRIDAGATVASTAQ